MLIRGKYLLKILAADQHYSVVEYAVPNARPLMRKERMRVDDECLGLQMMTSNECQRKIAQFAVTETKQEITHPASVEEIRCRIARKGKLGPAVSKKQNIRFLEIIDSFGLQTVIEGALVVVAERVDLAI